jgi:Glycosyltransferases involved in cell wall biogenesis
MNTPDTHTSIACIVPTYNNAATIATVVGEAHPFIQDIFIVNDGSIDQTGTIAGECARALPGVRVLALAHNSGKGFALKLGFEKAAASGFTNAITIDADGQHCAQDLAMFIEKVRKEPQTLWIGDRVYRESGADQPLRSSFGRAFGAFWYRFFTEKNIRDTQCGFRAYPLKPVLGLECKGSRYEYEQEVLIYSAWNGIDVKSLPIHRYYHSKDKTVSHFRPAIDLLRIGKVNSKAALIKILLPWKTVRSPGKTWREKLLIVLKRELNANSPHKGALSLAMGVCMGIMPIYGFQILSLMAVTPVLRLNWPLAFLGSCISSPPIIPFLIAAGIALGKIVVPILPFAIHLTAGVNALAKGGIEWFAGSIVLALVAAIATYGIFYPVLSGLNRQKNPNLPKGR